MNQFVINGIEKEIPVTQDASVRDLIKVVRNQLLSETKIIASIRINGSEIVPGDEVMLSGMTVGQIDSIEVQTLHPREMADETLQLLRKFTENIEFLCQAAAENLRAGRKGPELIHLIDGLSTMTEAIGRVRKINRLGAMQEVNILEADLLSILKDLLEFQQTGNKEFAIDLLSNHLPANMIDWREKGIPAMIAARSS